MARKGEGRITKSFGIPISKNEMYTKFEETVSREGKSASEVIASLIEEYTKVHANGNPQYELTAFQEDSDFQGFPAMGLKLGLKKKRFNSMRTSNQKLWSEMEDHVNQWKGLYDHE